MLTLKEKKIADKDWLITLKSRYYTALPDLTRETSYNLRSILNQELLRLTSLEENSHRVRADN